MCQVLFLQQELEIILSFSSIYFLVKKIKMCTYILRKLAHLPIIRGIIKNYKKLNNKLRSITENYPGIIFILGNILES